MNTNDTLQEIEHFVEDYKIRTTGIYNRDFCLYTLDKMLNDSSYHLNSNFVEEVKKIIAAGNAIENVYQQITEPLEALLEEEKKNISAEAILEQASSPIEIPDNAVVFDNEIEKFTMLATALGLTFVALKEDDDKLKLTVLPETKNVIDAILSSIQNLVGSSILFTCKEGTIKLAVGTSGSIQTLLHEINQVLEHFDKNHLYQYDLSEDFQQMVECVMDMQNQKQTFHVGVKIEENRKKYVLHSDDLEIQEKLGKTGISLNDGSIEFQTNDEKRAATILKGANYELSRLTKEQQKELGVKENISEAELENTKSTVTIYKKPIPGMENTNARITIITPLQKVGDTLIEIPTQDRFVELSLEHIVDGEVQVSTKSFHYDNGMVFDRDILPKIADDYKQETRIEGKHITQDEKDPSKYVITGEDGEKKEYISDPENEISTTEAIGSFIEETNFGTRQGVIEEQQKSEDGELEKDDAKVLVKVNNSQPSSNSQLADSVAGRANYIILWFIMIAQIMFIAAAFFLIQ